MPRKDVAISAGRLSLGAAIYNNRTLTVIVLAGLGAVAGMAVEGVEARWALGGALIGALASAVVLSHVVDEINLGGGKTIWVNRDVFDAWNQLLVSYGRKQNNRTTRFFAAHHLLLGNVGSIEHPLLPTKLKEIFAKLPA